MEKSQVSTEDTTNKANETSNITYEQIADALIEVGVCVFPKLSNEDKISNRQEHLHLLKTIQILAMKRKQFEDEENSKRAKVIEPLTVLTKGNKALLDEAQAKKKFLIKEIEINQQKLNALKQKKADQILQHEKELNEIKDKINDLNHSQKKSIHCSLSQSNILKEANKSKEDISLKKKRKSDVIRNKSKTLLDEIDEDNENSENNNENNNENDNENDTENEKKIQPVKPIKPRNLSQTSLIKSQSRNTRNSLPLDKVDNKNKHRQSLSSSMKTMQMRSPTTENYETIQKKMLALYQAKRKSRKSSVSLSSSQNILLNEDKKEDKNDDKNDDKKDESIKNKNAADPPKTTRSRIPKRPRINYTQC